MNETATFAGGCFWCMEAVFEPLRGVSKVVSGYAGGDPRVTSYEEVCRGASGHAEVVQVTFDPAVVSYDTLLRVFFAFHDPTTKDRQGADVGPQYRSAVFWHSEAQRAAAEACIAALEREGTWPDPVVTELAPFERLHPAEGYHQGYYARNPGQAYCRAVIAPKVAKLRAAWAGLLREQGAGA